MDFDEIAAILCHPDNIDFICLALINEIIGQTETLDLIVDTDDEAGILERQATVEELENAKKALWLLLEFASPEFQNQLTREDFEEMQMKIPDCLTELKLDEMLKDDEDIEDTRQGAKVLKFPLPERKNKRRKRRGGPKDDKKG